MKDKAFTLVEILVSVAIIMLLLALLFPVFKGAKKNSQISVATSNLRQIYTAISLYKNDNDGGYPLDDLDVLVDDGYLREPNLLMVSIDPEPNGYAKSIYECMDVTGIKYSTSYEDIFNLRILPDGKIRNFYYDSVRKHDENPGIVATRVFGDKHSYTSCNDMVTGFDGFTLRLREDGSVQRAHYRDFNPDGHRRYCWAGIFTDVAPSIICEYGD